MFNEEPGGRLEITTKIGCGVNCRYCPQELLAKKYFEASRRAGTMSLELFKICVDKLPREVRIDFSGMCEPWLNEEATEMVIYAHQKGHRIAVYTTLIGMRAEDFERIRDIPFECFVIHIPDEMMNSSIKITESYMALLERVISCVKDGKSIVTGYSCHAGIHPDIKRLVPENSNIIGEMIDRAGNLKSMPVAHQNHGGEILCMRSGQDLNHNVLLPDGTVVLCCMDYGLEYVLGNLAEQDYDEIINGEAARKIRAAMNDGSSDIICRKCSNAKTFRAYCEDLSNDIERTKKSYENILKDYRVYRDWAENLQKQIEELTAEKAKSELNLLTELKEYRGWVKNLETQCEELRGEKTATEENFVKELEIYRDWVKNLETQGEELRRERKAMEENFVKELEIYRGWVKNLEMQREELIIEKEASEENLIRELDIYRDWVNNLQKQFEDTKGEIAACIEYTETLEYLNKNLENKSGKLSEELLKIKTSAPYKVFVKPFVK